MVKDSQNFHAVGSFCLAGVLCSNTSFSLCVAYPTPLCKHVHVCAREHDACMSLYARLSSESACSPEGKPVESLTLLSEAAQLLPSWLLNGLGSNVPSCPSSAHQNTLVTQRGLKVNMPPTANTSTVTLEKFLFLFCFTFTEIRVF